MGASRGLQTGPKSPLERTSVKGNITAILCKRTLRMTPLRVRGMWDLRTFAQVLSSTEVCFQSHEDNARTTSHAKYVWHMSTVVLLPSEFLCERRLDDTLLIRFSRKSNKNKESLLIELNK